MPKQIRDENKKRINWFARNVKLRATPVFPGIEYRTITPAVKTLEDQEFLSFPPQELAVKVIRLSPHIFFSLPAVGLKVLETGLNGKLDDQAAFDVSRSDYKGTDLCELLHRVVRDPNSEKINFESTYKKSNELVKTATFTDKSYMTKFLVPYRPFEIGGNMMANEDATKDAFKNVLEPICALFSRLWKTNVALGSRPFKYKNQLDESDKIIYSAWPDIFVAENGQPLVCIEVKLPFINFSDNNAFNDVLTQAVSQCVASGTRYGAITDYFNTLCFKLLLEEDDIQSTKNNTYGTEVNLTMYKRVKVMYYIVNHRDSVNTLACVLAAHIFDAREENKDTNRQLLYKLGGALQLTRAEIAIRDCQSYEKFLVSIDSQNTRQDGKITFKLDDGREDMVTLPMYEIPFTEDSSITIIHEGPHYNAQVLMISGEVFHKITGVSPNDDRYILKIFDPVKGRFKGEETRNTFVRECEAYDELKNLWGQCIPRFYHVGYCSFHEGERIRFGGLFIILQFIEGSEPDLTDDEVVQSVEDGLDMMHTLGVIHGDVVLRKMIQTGDKKVFLVDFGLAGDCKTGNETKDLVDLQHAIRDAFTKN